MDLILWRHAEAVDLELVGCDMDRMLTPKGHKQATRMAHWLDRQLPDGAKILASPAVRAQETANALGRRFKTVAALAPLGNVAELLETVQWPNAKGCVMVVGHQPTLGKTIASLLGLTDEECAIKKGAVWWLRYRERDGHGRAVVVTVQSPDFL